MTNIITPYTKTVKAISPTTCIVLLS